MKLRGMDYKVIDDYFPEWIVSSMSAYFETFPVTWSNSSSCLLYTSDAADE